MLSDVLKRKSVNTNNGISSNSWTQTKGSNEATSSHRNLEATRNLVHKSSTLNNAEKEIDYFYKGNAHRNFEEDSYCGKSTVFIKLWKL